MRTRTHATTLAVTAAIALIAGCGAGPGATPDGAALPVTVATDDAGTARAEQRTAAAASGAAGEPATATATASATPAPTATATPWFRSSTSRQQVAPRPSAPPVRPRIEPPAPAGFTPITPSADSRLIYVSSSQGSDSNDCLSPQTPCRTVAAGAAKMRAGYPDHLYLRAGDTWRADTLTGVRSGRSPQEPAVVTSYGTGDRPVLENTGERLLQFNTGAQGLLHHVSFIGLDFDAIHLDADRPEFTGRHEDARTVFFLGGHSNLLFEDNVFNHIELVLQNWDSGAPTNIAVRRNIFTGAYTDQSSFSQSAGGRPSNVYADGVDGLLLEQNVFDHGGWHPTAPGAAGNMYNHNLYLQGSNVGARVVVRDNIITRASSHGIQARAGGMVDDNFFGRNAIGLLMGYNAEHPMLAGVPAHAHGNVITEGHSMIKGQSPCQGENLCTAALWGLQLSHPGESTVSIRGNVVHSRAPGDTAWQQFYERLSAQSYNLPKPVPAGVEDNIAWQWVDEQEGTTTSYPDPGRTLADYYDHLAATGVLDELVASGYVGAEHVDRSPDDGFVAYLDVVLHRAPGEWDQRLSADAINDHVREGFGL